MKHITAVVLLALTGCMTAPVFQMNDPSTDPDFSKVSGQCLAQANSVSNAQPGQARSIYVYCMQGKGWRKVN